MGWFLADPRRRTALKLAPGGAEAAWRRAAVLALAGRGAEAAAVAGRAPGLPSGDGWAWEAKWEACLFLHRDADAAAARRTAGGLAEKMWWYNCNSFGEKRERSRGPGRRSGGDAPRQRAGAVTTHAKSAASSADNQSKMGLWCRVKVIEPQRSQRPRRKAGREEFATRKRKKRKKRIWRVMIVYGCAPNACIKTHFFLCLLCCLAARSFFSELEEVSAAVSFSVPSVISVVP